MAQGEGHGGRGWMKLTRALPTTMKHKRSLMLRSERWEKQYAHRYSDPVFITLILVCEVGMMPVVTLLPLEHGFLDKDLQNI